MLGALRSAGGVVMVLVGLLYSSAEPDQPSRRWPQFGGPDRDFSVESGARLEAWGSTGPREVWRRELGSGTSPIAADGDMLYAVFLRGEFELVVAMDADTGMTIWQQPNFAPPAHTNASGPGAAPLVVEDTLVTIGATGKMHRFDRQDGTLEWALDLAAAAGGPSKVRTFAASPLRYRHTVIAAIDGPGGGLAAVDWKKGKVVWRTPLRHMSAASPVLVTIGDQPQLIAIAQSEILGLDPGDGTLLWTHPHEGMVTASPVPIRGTSTVFAPATARTGARLLKLVPRETNMTIEEQWRNDTRCTASGNFVRIGDAIYGSCTDAGSTTFIAIDLQTGATLWRNRDLPPATAVHANGSLVLLRRSGELLLGAPGASTLNVHARAKLLTPPSTTPPTVVGTRIYLRDQTHVIALDLER